MTHQIFKDYKKNFLKELGESYHEIKPVLAESLYGLVSGLFARLTLFNHQRL